VVGGLVSHPSPSHVPWRRSWRRNYQLIREIQITALIADDSRVLAHDSESSKNRFHTRVKTTEVTKKLKPPTSIRFGGKLIDTRLPLLTRPSEFCPKWAALSRGQIGSSALLADREFAADFAALSSSHK